MRRHLRECVQKELFTCQESPSLLNRRYFPLKSDIRNHMYKATIKQRFDKCDQTNVSSKVIEWKKTYPNDEFFFRPYADVLEQACGTADGENDHDKDEIKVASQTSRQKMMFAHQTSWQKALLKKYGNEICLLDATYKTTRYALPLFFLAVKTNVDYQIVASFVIQDETTDSIKEAIEKIKAWNPGWNPKYFMTDFCEEEISATEETFPGK